MARLRKTLLSDSDDSDAAPSILRASRIKASQLSLSEQATPSRRSTRQQKIQTTNSLREKDSDSEALMPKAENTPSRKQRTLKPVDLNTTLLQKLTVESIERKEKGVRRRQQEKSYDCGRQLAKSAVRRQLKIEKKVDDVEQEQVEKVEDGKEVEEEQDTTLWCGSESEAGSEEDEEDEDEDPVVDVKNQRRQLTKASRRVESDSEDSAFVEQELFGALDGGRNSDAAIKTEPVLNRVKTQSKGSFVGQGLLDALEEQNGPEPITSWSASENKAHQPALSVIDLTSSPEMSPAPKFIKPLPRSKVSSAPLNRPCSSSDNDVQAILQYSPPPPRFRSPRKAPPRSARPCTPPPAPSSPTKLISPSKRKQRIPTPPQLHPSLDAFWSADVINTWNDTYSPAKPLLSPKKNRSPSKRNESSDDDFPSPSGSPRKGSPSKKGSSTSPSVSQIRAQRKEFSATKHALASSFLAELDDKITGGRITSMSASTGGIKLIWSRTLKTTAGRANWRREAIRTRSPDDPSEILTTYRHHCSIELAEKVIDDEERLLNVLAHEYCHLTTFMISEVRNQPHGAEFKSWGRKVSQAFEERGVEVTTKHTYAIAYKYVWECEGCGYEFKRHSKSVDPSRHSCGRCKGRLVQTRPVPRGGEAKKSDYQIFVKENFSRVKKEMEGRGVDVSMGKVMEALGREYRETKEKGKMKAAVEVEELEIALEELNL